MMPDLGKYADAVLSAYAISVLLLIGLVILSVVQARHAKSALDDAEARRKPSGTK